MKLRDQMELQLPQNRELSLPVAPERANWWFDQMRKVVDGEFNFDAMPFEKVDAYAIPGWVRPPSRRKRTRRW